MVGFEVARFGLAPLNLGATIVRWAGAQVEPYAAQWLQAPDIRTLRVERPITEAEIGRQLVTIGRHLEPENQDRPVLLTVGHHKIVDALLNSYQEPEVPDIITEQVVDIAVRTGTDPVRLAPEHIDEQAAHRAAHIMHDFEPHAHG